MRLIFLLLLTCLLASVSGCTAANEVVPGFGERFEKTVRPYSFDFARWELAALTEDIRRRAGPSLPGSELTPETVVRYFTLTDELNRLSYSLKLERAQERTLFSAEEEEALLELEARLDELRPRVEETLARQTGLVLAGEGIFNPFFGDRFETTFPAVRFRLEQPLHLVVISPRDRIEKVRDRVLVQDLTAKQMEEIEAELDSAGVSSLVVEIGGFGATYPSFVSAGGSLTFTLETVAEEWLHQYLVFKPLGRAYVLHLLNILRNEDITTLNETVAGLVSQEVAAEVYERWYAGFYPEEEETRDDGASPAFDFYGAMREIRRQADRYLEAGEVEEAESYLLEMQQVLAEQGYYIRKLNQAYFAFHGSYAAGPASIDPAGRQVRALRNSSASLSGFLERASVLQTRQDLAAALETAGY